MHAVFSHVRDPLAFLLPLCACSRLRSRRWCRSCKACCHKAMNRKVTALKLLHQCALVLVWRGYVSIFFESRGSVLVEDRIAICRGRCRSEFSAARIVLTARVHSLSCASVPCCFDRLRSSLICEPYLRSPVSSPSCANCCALLVQDVIVFVALRRCTFNGCFLFVISIAQSCRRCPLRFI